MTIWGKVLGTLFGYMFGRLPGAILGFIVGHIFDKGYSQDFSRMGGFGRFFTNEQTFRQQAIFFHTLFSVMGHIAKADGKVTKEEIRVATKLMDEMGLQGDIRREAQQAFRDGKEVDFPLKATLLDFSQSCHGRRDILQVFLEILIQAAYADGKLDGKELKVLESVAKHLGFRQHELLYLMSMFEAELRFRRGQQSQQQSTQGSRQKNQPNYTEKQSLADAYHILGVSDKDDEKAIKKAYRKLMSEHHPDKLVSKGLPKQALEIAKTKAQDIQAAYEMIKKRRDIKSA